MEELVRLRMRPSRDNKSFRYTLDFVDENGKRRQVSLGHTDKRKSPNAETPKGNGTASRRIFDRGPMKLSQFIQDRLPQTNRRTGSAQYASREQNGHGPIHKMCR